MFSLNLSSLKEILFILCLFVLGWGYVDIRQKRAKTNSDLRETTAQLGIQHIETNRARFWMDKSLEKTRELYEPLKPINGKAKSDLNKLSEAEIDKYVEEATIYTAETKKYDSLYNVYLFTFKDDSLKTVVLSEKLEDINTEITNDEQDFKWLWRRVVLIAGLLFISLINRGTTKGLYELAELYKKGRSWFYCQSCGKKFSAKRNHSTNPDGTKNFAFCTTCHCDGKFTDAYTSMQDVFSETLSRFPNPSRRLRRSVINYVKSLERWNKRDYEPMNFETYFKEEPLKTSVWVSIDTWLAKFLK